MLEAPMYAPAAAFEMPAATPITISLEAFSLAELKNMPEAWAIMLKHLPTLQHMVSAPMIKPHLGNLSVHSLQVFSQMAPPETFTAINAELARLPPVQDIAP